MINSCVLPFGVCEKCAHPMQKAEKKGKRWGLYCENCGKFYKWASPEQIVIINARIGYLNKQLEVAGLAWKGGGDNI